MLPDFVIFFNLSWIESKQAYLNPLFFFYSLHLRSLLESFKIWLSNFNGESIHVEIPLSYKFIIWNRTLVILLYHVVAIVELFPLGADLFLCRALLLSAEQSVTQHLLPITWHLHVPSNLPLGSFKCRTKLAISGLWINFRVVQF